MARAQCVGCCERYSRKNLGLLGFFWNAKKALQSKRRENLTFSNNLVKAGYANACDNGSYFKQDTFLASQVEESDKKEENKPLTLGYWKCPKVLKNQAMINAEVTITSFLIFSSELHAKKEELSLLGVWAIDGNMFVKTSPEGRPIRIYPDHDLNNL